MSTELARVVNAAIPPEQYEEALLSVRATFEAHRRGRPRARSISAQRVQLRKAIGYASKLISCLETLGPESAIYLAPRRDDPCVVEHCASLNKLREHAEYAWKKLAHADRKAPKDQAFQDLLVRLCAVWNRSFPGEHGVTRSGRGSDIRSSGTHSYGGPLLCFVRALLKAEGIKHTHTGLGKRLYYLKLSWRGEPNTD